MNFYVQHMTVLSMHGQCSIKRHNIIWLPITHQRDNTSLFLGLLSSLEVKTRKFLCITSMIGVQEAQLSPSDRAMHRLNWNLANCHATVQKLLIRQVLAKSMVWTWRFSRRQCVIDNVHSTMTRPSRFHCPIGVINKPTTDELWISSVYRRLAVAKFFKSTI